MNIRIVISLFTFILLIPCEPGSAQSLKYSEAQKLLTENISEQKSTQEINNKLTSESQNVANSNSTPQLDLNIIQNHNKAKEKSISRRYFKTLTGRNLNIYGLNEFNQQQNENLLFFNVIGKDYKLGPGDIIQVIITGLNSLNKTFQVMNDGTISLENIYPINYLDIHL